MTSALVDQAGIYVLASVVPPVRVAQGGVTSLASVFPPIRVDQAGINAVVAITPNVPVSQAGMICLASGAPCTTQRAQIWIIRRKDGTVYRFTSLDRDLEYPKGSGVWYQSCGSLVPSASESVAEVGGAGNMDLAGAISAAGISEHDLAAGLFDGAWMESWMVPWAGTEIPRRLMSGVFGPVEYGDRGFRTELLGEGAKLMQSPFVQLLKPSCRFKFGDPKTCKKDLAPLTVTGTIDSAVGQRSFVDADRVEGAGYFRRGEITFTGGDNEGVTAEIKEHEAGGHFTLWPRVPFPMSTGDPYSMVPGCTLLKTSANGTNGCTAWGQQLRFGGADKVPTSDKRSAAATQRT